MKKSKLDPKFKAKWVKALLSGRYKQGVAALHKVQAGQADRFCCLGVACKVARLPSEKPDTFSGAVGYYSSASSLDGTTIARTGMLPPDFRRKIGLSVKDQSVLMRMNDASGSNFKQIAAWIKSKL